jgi:hypothetical protein
MRTKCTNFFCDFFDIKKLLSASIISILLTSVSAQPIITSFTPESGAVGTVVTIKGNNFSTTGNNIVFFGAAKANVLSNTDSTILVTVPVGATFLPISVTTNTLIATSKKPFILTFVGARSNFLSTGFGNEAQIPASVFVTTVCASDLDDDGLIDLITNSGNLRNIAIHQNLSAPGKIVFAQRKEIPNVETLAIVAADIDGDGKPDIIGSNTGYSRVVVYKNQSTPGSINFVQSVFLYGISDMKEIAAQDFDGDGKLDIAVLDGTNYKMYIHRNTTTNGIISFAAPVIFTTGSQPLKIIVQDIDGDSKKDIIISYYLSSNISIYRNNSTGVSSIDFDPRINIATPYGAGSMATGDLDMDDKPDIVVADTYSNLLTVFKNVSTPGLIALAPKVDFPTTPNYPSPVAISDLDGDGKLDIAVGVNNSVVSVYKNNSTLGNISLQTRVDYTNGGLQQYGMSIGDFDADGKPDIATANEGNFKTTVLRNRQGESIIRNLCPPLANTSFVSNEVGTIYQWQINDGTGFVDVTNGVNYAGTTTNTLQLINVPTSKYGYQYRCVVDNVFSKSNINEIRFSNTWLGVQNTIWENPLNWSCSVLPDIYTDVIINRTKNCYINSNVSVRSMYFPTNEALIVNAGFKLTIAH